MTNPLLSLLDLSDSDLSALAAALRAGKVGPDSPPALVGQVAPGLAASGLPPGDGHGLTGAQLALVLDALVASRRQMPRMSDDVELVWTGPEAPGMVNRDSSVVLRDLFGRAERSVLVVGFALVNGGAVFAELAARMALRPGLCVRLCINVERKHGDTSLSSEIAGRFAAGFRKSHWPFDCPPPEVYFDPRSVDPDPKARASLHAKCVVVDRAVALVTSANLTEAALKRNIEAGVVVRSPEFAAKVGDHFDRLISHGLLKRLSIS